MKRIISTRFPTFTLLFLLTIGIVYSPVLYFDNIFHDDILFFVKVKEDASKLYLWGHLVTECRYGFALLLALGDSFVNKVSDLKVLKLLAIIISSCNAHLILKQMRRLDFSDIQSFLILATVFCLPGFANILFCAEYSYIVALSVLLACWSFHKVETDGKILVPAIFFFFSASIYPPTAMFYWAMVGLYILFAPHRHSAEFKNKVLRFMAVGSTGLFIYAISVFFMHYSFSQKVVSPLYNPYAINQNVIGKLHWFAREPLGNALNLWNIFPNAVSSSIILGFIILTALVVLVNKLRQNESQKRTRITLTYIWQAVLFIVVFFLSFLPNLVSTGDQAFYRCLIPLSSLVWFIVVWAIIQWMSIFPRILTQNFLILVLCALLLNAGITTNTNVLNYRVLPSAIEWNAYRSMGENIHNKSVDSILVVLPGSSPLQRYDEFCVLSSHYLGDIYPLVYAAFKETRGDRKFIMPLVFIADPGQKNAREIREYFYTKGAGGKWVYKYVNGDEKLHEFDHAKFGDTLDSGLSLYVSPPRVFTARENWYILNLNDLFDPKTR